MAPCLAFVPALMVDESVATLTPYLDAISSMSILLAMMDRPKLFRFSQLGVRVVLTGGYLSSTCRFLPSTSLCVPLSKYATKWRWREEGSPIGNQQRSRYSKHPAMNILFIVQAVPVRLAGLHRIHSHSLALGVYTTVLGTGKIPSIVPPLLRLRLRLQYIHTYS